MLPVLRIAATGEVKISDVVENLADELMQRIRSGIEGFIAASLKYGFYGSPWNSEA